MLNIQKIITEKLWNAYKFKYDIIYPLDQLLTENPNFLKVIRGNSDSDYKLSLVGLLSFLGKIEFKRGINELSSDLLIYFNSSDFIAKLDNNCIVISITTNYIAKLLFEQFSGSPKNFSSESLNRDTILVDFSSPNIAKDMHVGHLRSTIIGDSICNLFEYLGYNVLRVNHIGDFGLQFGMIIEYLLRLYPEYETENINISDLQTFYAFSKKEFDNDPVFAKAAYQKVVLLQSGDPDITRAWLFIKEISRRSYDQIYTELGIQLIEYGESFYQSMIPSMIEELERANLLIDDEGRKIIKKPGEELLLTVRKSDGGYTYDTTDLAAIRYRLTQIEPTVTKVIYVVDSGQSKHFELIFWVADTMGWKKINQELIHVGFGLVLGPDGKKFKSRSGDTVKLKDLLADSLTEASKLVSGQKDFVNDSTIAEIVKTVAYGSLKYGDLRCQRIKNYNFSMERMLSLKGNTGVYQLYEYVRICGIFRKARPYLSAQFLEEDLIGIRLSWSEVNRHERHLGMILLFFYEVIDRVRSNLNLHTLCDYLYNLSDAFSQFHINCRVINFKSSDTNASNTSNDNKDNNNSNDGNDSNGTNGRVSVDMNRLLLCAYTKRIMEICFKILGLRVIERM